eukprot:g28405.t1
MSCRGCQVEGYVEDILKSIVQGTPSFCRDTTDFLQKLSSHEPVKPGTFFVTMDILTLYNSIPHDDSITATASVLSTNNCQFPYAILQLIRFILSHNIFTFIQTHGRAMGIRFAPQYTNIFVYSFAQDVFAAQSLRPTLYTRHIEDIFILWTHGEESLKQLHSNISKFHPTTKVILDYSLESISFLDTRISIRQGHLRTSFYRKSKDNLMRLLSLASPTDKPYTYTES